MFETYNPLGLPNDDTTKVGVAMQLYRLQTLDLMENQAVIFCEFNIYWHDERLKWDPAQYGNITKTRFSADPDKNDNKVIWTPDIEYKENSINGLFN